MLSVNMLAIKMPQEIEYTSIVPGQAGEIVLQTFGNLLEEYGSQLAAIQEAVSGSTEFDFYPINIEVSYYIYTSTV